MPIAALNIMQIDGIARLLRDIPDLPDLDYAGALYPPPGAKHALDYFFGTVLHQYGFWEDDGGRYIGPMFARIGGERLKGSDFVWKAAARTAAGEPDFFNPDFQAEITPEGLAAAFGDDSGACPLPIFDSHVTLARGYGRDLLGRGLTPKKIVDAANASRHPLKTLLLALGEIPGYREDPLRKKALLLALILDRRPERFLTVKDPENWAPIVDYHNIRTALRTGMAEARDDALRSKLLRREFVTKEEEGAVRKKTFDAIVRLLESSGAGVARIDALFFGARKTCPEMTRPDCPRCLLETVCAKKIDLFQPVFRTTYY